MDAAEALRMEDGAGLGTRAAAAICTLGDLDGVGTCTLGDLRDTVICTLGDYWHPDRDERTEIGQLIHQAKDQADPGAARALAERFANLAEALPDTGGSVSRLVAPVPTLPETDGGVSRVVAPVPSLPEPAGEGQRHIAALLAASLATAGAGEYRPDLLAKSNPTPRMRHIARERRTEVAASAGYRAREPVAGRHIVVVDDVVLTGTTLHAVAACLRDAGAASVTAAAAARTRLR